MRTQSAERLIAALNLAAFEAGRFPADTLDAALALSAVRAACREAQACVAGEGPYAVQPEPQAREAVLEPAHA